jgi:hypothetical protein
MFIPLGSVVPMYDPLDRDSDPFRPPAIPTLVGCIHCGQEYDSYRIEWRVEQDADGKQRGFWCCPIEGCGGCGFGFDILPVDPNYEDERGGWVSLDDGDDKDDDEAEEFLADDDGETHPGKAVDGDDDPVPY